MRKLLLLINICCIYFLIDSCQDSQQSKAENTKESKVEIQDSAISKDTVKIKMQTSNSGIVGTSQGVQKDSIKRLEKGTAIIHTDPDQAKIDSIKSAKMKTKK